MSLVEATHLSKAYGGFLALDDLTLTLPKGRVIGLLGPNGSGKTTFIKLLCGLLTPTAGTVTVNGHPIGAESKACVAYLPERNALPLYMTGRALIAYYADMFPDFDAARAEAMLRDLGIDLSRSLRMLSKGMKEKVQLAVTMSRRAALYVLDEPIAGVDPAAREYILETVFKNRDPESTLLISTHLIRDIEEVLDEFVFIRRGKLMCYDAVENLHQDGKTVDELFREVFRWEN